MSAQGSRRRWPIALGAGAVLLVAGAVVAVVLLVNWSGGGGDMAVDESDGPGGTLGLVLLAERHGAEFFRAIPPFEEEADVALLHAGTLLNHQERTAVTEWVEGGGVLVSLGPARPWVLTAGTVPAGEVRRGECDLGFLADVETLETASDVTAVTAEGAQSCFGTGRGGLVSAAELGDGAVVGVATQQIFTNQWLAAADNSVLATALLAPERGTRVAVIESAGGIPSESGGTEGPPPGYPGPGEPGEQVQIPAVEERETLADLIPSGVLWGIGQLLLALAVLAIWKARRFGRPVSEPAPVPLAGARLVEAVGELLRRAGTPERAGEMLCSDLHAELSAALGLPRDASVELVADRAAAASGSRKVAEDVLGTLGADPPDSGEELARLARRIDEVRKEVLGGVNART